jgi:predicted O-methyltransferase YrrM
MEIEKIRAKVDGIPHMTFAQAKAMTALILEHKPGHILELGFRHGVSTCYMAGAMDEIGGGHITTIDLASARDAEPNVLNLLETLGLSNFVTAYFEPTSYTWRLMRMLEAEQHPRFDLCYIDGAHDWATDGFAFFLVDRLLAPGDLIIFDDLDWTYGRSPALRDTDKVRCMPEEERSLPQIRKVFELLVVTHPGYGDFMEKDGWAYARKKPISDGSLVRQVEKLVVYERPPKTEGRPLRRLVNCLKRQLANRGLGSR